MWLDPAKAYNAIRCTIEKRGPHCFNDQRIRDLPRSPKTGMTITWVATVSMSRRFTPNRPATAIRRCTELHESACKSQGLISANPTHSL